MQGDSIHADQGLDWSRRVQNLKRSLARSQAVRDEVSKDLQVKFQEVDVLTSKIERLTKVSELFKILIDRLVLDQVKVVERVVSEGLRAIFYDQTLKFEAEVGQRYNKVAIDFFIRQGDSIRGNPLESFGGGPSSIASLILRLLTLLRFKRWPILLLDETLAAVSDDYVDQAGRFLRHLATITKMDILMVTHKSAYLEHAGVAYQGQEEGPDEHGALKLGLQRLRSPTK